MVCVSYTAPIVTAVAPIVTNLTILGASGISGLGIKWYQDIAGAVKVYVDGQLALTPTGGVGYNQVIVNVGSLTTNHQICVE